MDARISEARSALAHGHVDHASTLVRAALEHDPKSVDGLNLLANIAIQCGNPREAAELLAQAAPLDSTPRSAMNHALALEMIGDREQAIAVYEAILAAQPEHRKARERLIRTCTAVGATERAVAVADFWAEPTDLAPETRYALALCYLKLGRPAAGEALLDQLLHTAPDHLPAQLAKAGLLAARSQNAPTLSMLRRVLAQDPASADAILLLGQTFVRTHEAPQAESWLLRATLFPTQRVPASRELGLFLRSRNRHQDAVAFLKIGHDADPESATLTDALVQSLLQLKRNAEVTELIRSVLDKVPDDPTCWNALSIELKTAGQPELATQYMRRSVALFPSEPVLLYNLGNTLNELTRAEEAEQALKRAVILAPKYAKAWNSLCVALSFQFRNEEAAAAAQAALKLNPKLKSAYLNLSAVMRGRGDFGASIRCLRKALELDPKYVEAEHGLAYALLTVGEIEQGFKAYDSRWAIPGFTSARRPYRKPIWDGQDLTEDGILVYMEQGMGDEIMFSWYLHLLRRDAKRVMLECDHRLIPLFKRTFPEFEYVQRRVKVDPRAADPGLRYKAPVGHLPKHYWYETREHIRTVWSLANRHMVRTDPYLVADATRVEYWRAYLRDRFGGRPLIGVSWRSAIHNRMRDLQYTAPEDIAQIFGYDIALINLQYATEPEEVEIFTKAGQRFGFHFLHPEGVDLKDDLDDVMALISALDLVVTPLISVAWMAGALGVPTWVLRTSETPLIWQQLGTPMIPWCPSMRLFFRHPLASWETSFNTVRSELKAWLAGEWKIGDPITGP
ncbi:tetratricopeptide repeat protein [Azospirillum sp.]|uniref:tetratricopeptide repeat protein n=1 Tax=Azospirillum sp. TaxID=34012 RepID=UPI002D52F8F1|nr:tetratricopeptide repeat protein [Azospirillum sp.]HYD63841.1 tetratricopeptide repeat protein [Azospirillum sp.]